MACYLVFQKKFARKLDFRKVRHAASPRDVSNSQIFTLFRPIHHSFQEEIQKHAFKQTYLVLSSNFRVASRLNDKYSFTSR